MNSNLQKEHSEKDETLGGPEKKVTPVQEKPVVKKENSFLSVHDQEDEILIDERCNYI